MGCPSIIDFEESSDMKATIIEKGNQATFKMYPDIVKRQWIKKTGIVIYFLWNFGFSIFALLSSYAQGILVKPGKNPCIIFNASTKGDPHEVVLNEITPTKFEATIDFGKSKTKLLTTIYNWSHPWKRIYLALTDITACFRFPSVIVLFVLS